MHDLNRNIYIIAICLSALAGCVDVIGFIELGGYFISFMTGNSTRLSVDIANGDFSGVIFLATVIALFVIGAMLGMVVRRISKPKNAASNVVYFITTMLIIAALSYELGIGNFIPIVFMILAMGAENAVLQKKGNVVGLTYMTGTLVKVGHQLADAILGGSKTGWVPYFFLWFGLIVGGAVGAVLYHYLSLHSIWITAIWAACLAYAITRMKHLTA